MKMEAWSLRLIKNIMLQWYIQFLSKPAILIEDADLYGAKVGILLHVYKGKMCELEFYKDNSTKILCLPDVNELVVETNGTPWAWTTDK
jgi:hypothetical protein